MSGETINFFSGLYYPNHRDVMLLQNSMTSHLHLEYLVECASTISKTETTAQCSQKDNHHLFLPLDTRCAELPLAVTMHCRSLTLPKRIWSVRQH